MRARALASVLAVLLLARAAAADPGGDAERLAADALARYHAADYRAAAELFLAAYERSRVLAMLNNAAKAFEAADDLARAIETWRRYLASPDLTPDKRAVALARLEAVELRARELRPLGEGPAARPAPARPPDEPEALVLAPAPSEAETTDVLGVALTSVGGALLATGGGLLLSAWLTHAAYEDGLTGTPTVSRADADAAELRAGLGVALLGVGAGALIGGVLALVLDGAVAPAPAGLAGRF